MRYSILGFNQERVLNLTAVTKCKDKDGKDKDVSLSLDVNDLLILNLLADFPNRTTVKKIMKGDKVFFWASYDEILKELPILNVKKHALALRFDKLEKLHIIEREFLTISSKNNLTFFSLTKVYETLLYGDTPSSNQLRYPSSNQLQDPLAIDCDTLSQSNAGPSSSQLQDINNIVKDIKEKDTITEDKGDTIVSYEGEPSRGKEESIDWNAFLKFFNDTMANKAIKPISVITNGRKGNIRARMREYKKKALFVVITKAAASDFLNGKNPRGFTATFDWLFKPSNFPKVLEGNYDNREGQQFFNNQNNNYGRETVTDKMRRTIAEAEDFDRQLTAQREANMGNGDSKPVW